MEFHCEISLGLEGVGVEKDRQLDFEKKISEIDRQPTAITSITLILDIRSIASNI